ncbi:hypothetical protein ACN27G_27540 [Plantactinospora sp. WMMB334]|uniref:hypothetical protein n=1 Tax=Plantactinospora sp. WMMB334 TaxID=3404119 RepID=UPI003B92EE09
MTTDEQVTHPPVTHPETITLKVAQERPRKVPDGVIRERTKRRRRPLPPPKTIAAVALVVAALELLIWQVGGLWWGIGIHLAAVVLFLLPTGVLLFLAWRKARAARRTGTTQAARKVTTTSTTHGGGPLRRLFGPARGKSGRDRESPAGGRQRKPGLLGKLFPGRGRTDKAPVGGSGRPSGSRRSPLGRLFGPGRRSSPKGATRSGPAGGRSPKGSLFRNPFRGGTTPAGSKASPTGSRSRNSFTRRPSSGNPSGQSPKGRGGRFWPDLLKGIRQGAAPQPAAQAEPRRKPSPGPTAVKPAQTQKAQPAQPKHTNEERVREAVQKAADVKPAPVTTPRHTGGSYMGDMNRVRAAADDLAAALREYDPENMHQMFREMPHLGEALGAVAAGMRQMASRAESEWPVAPEVAEALRSVSTDIKAAAGTAEEARGTVRKENETDIERGEAPRHGSRDIEAKWDVRDAD